MSYHLIDFESFNFDNLIIWKKIISDQDNLKYYIYYQQENETPKEIYIKLPRLRLIYNLANQKFNQLNIPIYPNWEQTNNFINFIQKFESDINECFLNKSNKEWISIINKKNSINFIKTNVYENYKITSDIENKKITINDFKINGEIDVVIKISYVWSKNNKIGLSSQLYQIKYFAPPDQLEINFIDPEEKKQVITKIINPEVKLAEKSTLLNRVPNIKDLQKAIKGLKPIVNKE